MSDGIIGRPARELVADIAARRVSCVEVMQAHLARIEQINPHVNALVSLQDPEAALAQARAADTRIDGGAPTGALLGLPMAVKDLVDVAGMPTTSGSTLFAERMANSDSLLAARLRGAGALLIGKTNVPEFGLGSHTFNPVFGITRNPHDLSRSAGGSSGGAAAALASGMLQLADGSDMGGSLRNPGSFNGVVGLRPSIGRVPTSRSDLGWLARLSTEGPLGRSVADVALLLDVLSGPAGSDPLALPDHGRPFADCLDSDTQGVRICWTPDFGGLYPVEPEVRAVAEAALVAFRAAGCELAEGHPDARGAMDVFQAQRAAAVWPLAQYLEAQVPDWRQRIKQTAVWNFDNALAQPADVLLRSELERTRIYRNFVTFFQDADFLVLPTVQVRPFPVETEYPTVINGVALPTYLDWMASCCVVSITGLPAISVPCGRTDDGLPVGLQIVGPPRADQAVLQIAHAFERALEFDARPVGLEQRMASA